MSFLTNFLRGSPAPAAGSDSSQLTQQDPTPTAPGFSQTAGQQPSLTFGFSTFHTPPGFGFQPSAQQPAQQPFAAGFSAPSATYTGLPPPGFNYNTGLPPPGFNYIADLRRQREENEAAAKLASIEEGSRLMRERLERMEELERTRQAAEREAAVKQAEAEARQAELEQDAYRRRQQAQQQVQQFAQEGLQQHAQRQAELKARQQAAEQAHEQAQQQTQQQTEQPAQQQAGNKRAREADYAEFLRVLDERDARREQARRNLAPEAVQQPPTGQRRLGLGGLQQVGPVGHREELPERPAPAAPATAPAATAPAARQPPRGWQTRRLAGQNHRYCAQGAARKHIWEPEHRKDLTDDNRFTGLVCPNCKTLRRDIPDIGRFCSERCCARCGNPQAEYQEYCQACLDEMYQEQEWPEEQPLPQPLPTRPSPTLTPTPPSGHTSPPTTAPPTTAPPTTAQWQPINSNWQPINTSPTPPGSSPPASTHHRSPTPPTARPRPYLPYLEEDRPTIGRNAPPVRVPRRQGEPPKLARRTARHSSIYHNPTPSDAQAKKLEKLWESQKKNQLKYWTAVNIPRPAGFDEMPEPVGDEPAPVWADTGSKIPNHQILHNKKSDYAWGYSQRPNGLRTARNQHLPHASVNMMKKRLGLTGESLVELPYEHSPRYVLRDEPTLGEGAVVAGLQEEFLAVAARLFGLKGLEDEVWKKKRGNWDLILREFVRESTLLGPTVKDILLRFTGEDINPDNEWWDQERRFFWHALDVLCTQFAGSIRARRSAALEVAIKIRSREQNAFYNNPENPFPNPLGDPPLDMITGLPFPDVDQESEDERPGGRVVTDRRAPRGRRARTAAGGAVEDEEEEEEEEEEPSSEDA